MESSNAGEQAQQLRRQSLSALLDGECAAAELRSACAQWVQDPQQRADWHCFALIGDVMRSDDLAPTPGRDEDFLQALRSQLATEPVVLAPQPLQPPVAAELAEGLHVVQAPVRQRWLRPRAWGARTAMAGAVMAVAGVWWGVRMPSADPAAPVGLAQATPPVVAGQVIPVATPWQGGGVGTDQAPQPGGGQMLRNPDLDRYLAAHRQYAHGPALAAPGGLRQVAVTPDGQ